MRNRCDFYNWRDGGELLTFGMSIVTLSLLITTWVVYVPDLGGDTCTRHCGFFTYWGLGAWC